MFKNFSEDVVECFVEDNHMNNIVSEENFTCLHCINLSEKYSLLDFQNLCNTINIGLLELGYCNHNTYVEIDCMNVELYVELFDEYDNVLGIIKFASEESDTENYVLIPSIKAVKKWDWSYKECEDYLRKAYVNIIKILSE